MQPPAMTDTGRRTCWMAGPVAVRIESPLRGMTTAVYARLPGILRSGPHVLLSLLGLGNPDLDRHGDFMIRRLVIAATMAVSIAGSSATAAAAETYWHSPSGPAFYAESCSGNEYENSDGVCIPRPTQSQIPSQGATAQMQGWLVFVEHPPIRYVLGSRGRVPVDVRR